MFKAIQPPHLEHVDVNSLCAQAIAMILKLIPGRRKVGGARVNALVHVGWLLICTS